MSICNFARLGLTILHGIRLAVLLLPRRPEAAPSRSGSVEAAPKPGQEALCLSSRRPSSPSYSQQWADATSFLHGVDSCDTIFSQFPIARRRRFRRCPDSGFDTLGKGLRYAGQGVVAPCAAGSAPPPVAAPEEAQGVAARARCGGGQIRLSRYRRAGRLWHLPWSPH